MFSCDRYHPIVIEFCPFVHFCFLFLLQIFLMHMHTHTFKAEKKTTNSITQCLSFIQFWIDFFWLSPSAVLTHTFFSLLCFFFTFQREYRFPIILSSVKNKLFEVFYFFSVYFLVPNQNHFNDSDIIIILMCDPKNRKKQPTTIENLLLHTLHSRQRKSNFSHDTTFPYINTHTHSILRISFVVVYYWCTLLFSRIPWSDGRMHDNSTHTKAHTHKLFMTTHGIFIEIPMCPA